MAERLNALVLKTSIPQGIGGSNPSFSAKSDLITTKSGSKVAFICYSNSNGTVLINFFSPAIGSGEEKKCQKV